MTIVIHIENGKADRGEKELEGSDVSFGIPDHTQVETCTDWTPLTGRLPPWFPIHLLIGHIVERVRAQRRVLARFSMNNGMIVVYGKRWRLFLIKIEMDWSFWDLEV